SGTTRSRSRSSARSTRTLNICTPSCASARGSPRIPMRSWSCASSLVRWRSASDDPVRVLEEYATVDLLSGGRAEIMAGRGSFVESFPLFGYDLADYDTVRGDDDLDRTRARLAAAPSTRLRRATHAARCTGARRRRGSGGEDPLPARALRP